VSHLYVYRAELVRVVDGDTVELHVDLGFKVAQRMTIRLAGLDAPELRARAGPAARAHLELLLAGPGALYLKSQKDRADKYGGRWLGELLKEPDVNVNAAMLEAGHGKPYTGQEPKP
jgi:micrococcal nuclease